MKSRLQIAGHPIHVMTVGVPIGLYTAAFVADALYVLVHDAFWYAWRSGASRWACWATWGPC